MPTTCYIIKLKHPLKIAPKKCDLDELRQNGKNFCQPKITAILP